MAESSPLEPIRTPEDAREAQLVSGAPQLFHCKPGIVQRDERYPLEPSPIVAAILGEPVVVGAADSGRDSRFDLIIPDDVEAQGGKLDRDVYAVTVHVSQIRSEMKAMGNTVGKDRPVQRVLGKERRAHRLGVIATIARQLVRIRNRPSVDIASRLKRPGD